MNFENSLDFNTNILFFTLLFHIKEGKMRLRDNHTSHKLNENSIKNNSVYLRDKLRCQNHEINK